MQEDYKIISLRSSRGKLIQHAKKVAGFLGYEALYYCTDHINYYEKYSFQYIGIGYHPWGETSRIYKCKLL